MEESDDTVLTSTVGFPLESRISLANTPVIEASPPPGAIARHDCTACVFPILFTRLEGLEVTKAKVSLEMRNSVKTVEKNMFLTLCVCQK